MKPGHEERRREMLLPGETGDRHYRPRLYGPTKTTICTTEKLPSPLLLSFRSCPPVPRPCFATLNQGQAQEIKETRRAVSPREGGRLEESGRRAEEEEERGAADADNHRRAADVRSCDVLSSPDGMRAPSIRESDVIDDGPIVAGCLGVLREALSFLPLPS